MIFVVYKEKPSKPVKTPHCYQWDYNQTLCIEDVPCAITPEVHFWQEGLEKALVVKGTFESNKHHHTVTAVIPNQMLQNADPITAYLYDETAEEFGETISAYQIPIIEREQPEDYVYAENGEPISPDDEFKIRRSTVDAERTDSVRN
ncbi:hypothetical protein [Ileibacterium valens]|uniref:hypothetical protein n=1 Tax=Ileibacterium valens TaxID=1862668 RepID=UPI00272F6E44|nr:hypothetical protein [Ileibacterium valens]